MNLESSRTAYREDRRRHSRADSPTIVFEFGDQSYRTRNWSMGGFLIEDYEGALVPGALVTITGVGPGEGRMKTVKIRARVLRRDESRSHLAVGFLGVDQSAYSLMKDLQKR
ncbi:MAG: PilZ domain-containing protein [Rhodobacterales bacterium]|nr:PilZ domain-containing protein [Rhodobacterales bacterium]